MPSESPSAAKPLLSLKPSDLADLKNDLEAQLKDLLSFVKPLPSEEELNAMVMKFLNDNVLLSDNNLYADALWQSIHRVYALLEGSKKMTAVGPMDFQSNLRLLRDSVIQHLSFIIRLESNKNRFLLKKYRTFAKIPILPFLSFQNHRTIRPPTIRHGCSIMKNSR